MAKLKFRAAIISAVGNWQLSVGKLQLFASQRFTFLSHGAAAGPKTRQHRRELISACHKRHPGRGQRGHARRPRPKSGGTKSENYWFEKPSFFKTFKNVKSPNFGGFIFFYLSCNL